MNSGSSASIGSGSHGGVHAGGRYLLVVPHVAAGLHGHVAVDALDHDDLLDGGLAADGDVGVGLAGRGLGAAVALVGADEHLGPAVVDAVLRASAEKPPKTIMWMAPMRAQASMTTASSGIIGR